VNLTLGTLEELKAHLLAEALRSGTDYDGAITAIGKGVAARFEQFCDRKFARVEDDTYECGADRSHVSLPRYPVEEISAIHLRETMADGWVDQGTVNDLLLNLSEAAGLAEFGSSLGSRTARIKLTYTGGYWIDESADGSVDNRSAVQKGSVALSAADESKAITFGVEFASAPVVSLSVVIPADGTIIPVSHTTPTTTGVTAILGFPVPATGYTLQWIAVGANESGSGGAMPAGATEVPHDLKLAWLQQCEFLWKLRDKLGLGIAGGGDGSQLVSLTLAGAKLIPDVEETLQRYKRFSLL
jgi:hypothetical protein